MNMRSSDSRAFSVPREGDDRVSFQLGNSNQEDDKESSLFDDSFRDNDD